MALGASSRRGRGGSAFRYGVINAAQLAEASYRATTHPSLKPRIVKSISKDDVEAHLLDNGILLIPGSNSFADYLKYNFNIGGIGGRKSSLSSRETGKSNGAFWHQGFLAHADIVFNAFKSQKPRYIIGHSLGAASAQILSLRWQVHSIGFAAPRVYLGKASFPVAHLNLSIFRSDDIVGSMPSDYFSHAGKPIEIKIQSGRMRHKMRHYRSVLTDPNFKNTVPNAWPIG